jgi:hypothetical protein
MSKKKLLNERTIRRFGGLAGIKPISTTSFLSEMGEMAYARDDEDELEVEDELEIEEPGGEELEIEDELEIEEPVAAGADDLVVSLLDKVKEWAADQGVEMDVEGEGEEELDMELGGEEELDMDMDMDAEEDDLELDMDAEETLEEMINSILGEDARTRAEEEGYRDGEEDEKDDLEEGEKPWGEKKGDKSDTDKEDKDYVGKNNPKNESRRRTSKRRAPANESRRRTKQTKRAKSRGVKVQVLSDEKVIQEVTKRVKNRLARIAKAQKRRS